MKSGGGHRVSFHLPVGEGGGSYSFAHGGVFGGIGRTKAPAGEVSVGKVYRVDMRVGSEDEEAEIVVRVNGAPHLRWKGNPSKLGMDMPTKEYLGIGTFFTRSTVLFSDLRLRMISGRAELLR